MTPRETEILRRDGLALALGMEWFPLLGEHLPGQARALARRRRASHWVITSGGAASAGLWRVRAGAGKGGSLRSAAAVFAALHPAGTVAALLPLADGRLWLVAAHEGAVMTRADQLHDDPAGAYDAVSLLRETYPGLVVHDEGLNPSGLLEALFGAARDYGALQRLAPVSGGSLLAWLAVALPLAGVLAFTPVRQWLPGEGGDAGLETVDPLQAWQAAVAASARQHAVHGVAGLRAALDTLHAVPVFLSGWRLARMECRPGARQWHCHANYRREGASDNQGFIDAALPGWSLSFDPMEGATAAWTASLPALSLADVSPLSAQRNEARLFSALQAMLPAFADFRIEAPQALALAAPLDADQRPLARPSGLVSLQRRPIRLEAPLRSLSMLLPETMHMSWDRIVVRLAMLDQPTLRSSSLRVSLSGVLYEKTDDVHRIPASLAAGPVSGARIDAGGHGD